MRVSEMQSESGYFLYSILNRVLAEEAPPTPGEELSPAALPLAQLDACQAVLDFDWTILAPPNCSTIRFAGGRY